MLSVSAGSGRPAAGSGIDPSADKTKAMTIHLSLQLWVGKRVDNELGGYQVAVIVRIWLFRIERPAWRRATRRCALRQVGDVAVTYLQPSPPFGGVGVVVVAR